MLSNENLIKIQLINGLKRNVINKIIDYIEIKNVRLNDFNSLVKLLKNLGLKQLKINIDYIEEEAINILNLCKRSNIEIVGIYDEKYPHKLKYVEDRPLVLYIRGNADLLNHYSNISIVGSKNPSQKCYEISSILSEKLAEENCCVVTGLSEGCEEAAHTGSITANGKTIAVIPSGHNKIPKTSKMLYNMILLNGGVVVSEFPPNTKADKNSYIERNRIVAALSEGMIVIEGDKKGVTYHAVKYAKELNKPIAFTNIIEETLSNIKNNDNIYMIDSFTKLENFKNKSIEKNLDKVH